MGNTLYPYQASCVSRASATLGLDFKDLDNGYIFSVSNGINSFIAGTGHVTPYPLNLSAAAGLCREKWNSFKILSAAKIPTIPSRIYFITDNFSAYHPPGTSVADLMQRAKEMKGPIFCKPNDGKRGNFAEIISNIDAMPDYITRVKDHHDAILLQPVMAGDEYRIFCLNGKAIYSARKAEWKLQGNGTSTVQDLLDVQNTNLVSTGVSPLNTTYILDYIYQHHQFTGQDILPAGKSIIVPGRRNLSGGGDITDFTTDVPYPLAKLALAAANAMGVRVAGVDIFDISEKRDLSNLVAIEVNANPGIVSLSYIGRDDVADQIWTEVLTTYFKEQAILNSAR